MSRLLISQYHAEVEKIIQYGGSRKETSIRTAFQNLLNAYCQPRDYLLIPELDYKTKSGKTVYPDGTVKDAIRLDYGYWEAKDRYDNLDEEIDKKLAKGYPDKNILFEDSQTAVLIQSGEETGRVEMRDMSDLDGLIAEFINYVPPEVSNFRQAINAFKEDIPTILEALRDLIAKQAKNNNQFLTARNKFLDICQQSINPEISLLDVREMIIQHILTEDIFINIFNNSDFHRENNIARELQNVVNSFFTGKTKRNTFAKINSYYEVIKRTAVNIGNHHEKQRFLKAVYENFYKAYNPKAADRLGIVYTPNEIVRFMIESVDYLTHKHFNKLLADPGVDILDPCTGTATYITELIEYLPKNKLKHKYQNEIHCNEVSILPYYIANLNIEYTYQQKMGEYEEFDNICFVDTLEHTSFYGKQMDLFALSVENTARIKRQNDKQISVIIGNPPYNANQENFNDNNANRSYSEIDKRIKNTYVKSSTSQKTKLYDMYTRFIRWATDRLNNNGIVAFITNSSFIDARTFDGFRKVVADEFSEIYLIDLGGNVRANPKLSGTTHNVFGIQTGVAICFLVKKEDNNNTPCKMFYARRSEFDTAKDKLQFLGVTKFKEIDFLHTTPDKQNNWINQTNNDFNELIPLIDKDVKAGKSEQAIFKLFSLGIATNRDEWVYDRDKSNLINKINFLTDVYNHCVDCRQEHSSIKWSSSLKKYAKQNFKTRYREELIKISLYRPYYRVYTYTEKIFNDRLTNNHYEIYSHNLANFNSVIVLTNISSNKLFHCLASNTLIDLHLTGDSQCLPLYTYDKSGNRIENITDWGLKQFQDYYSKGNLGKGSSRIASTITKSEIFYYVYAVLHDPQYREKYQQNLKRDFPRIPFYDNFLQWVAWGRQLMDLHINYETVEPYQLKRIDLSPNPYPTRRGKQIPKVKLKTDKEKGTIILDTDTSLHGVPAEAWQYKLGNRSAIEWVLDQYKEKKPKDQTIAEKFNTYRFADYKEEVIELLQKVCQVSVETIKIIEQMTR
ncbi:Adenine specific DNA methyltransferase [Hyella patelloides LEGE 07179]|uniref:site-specific DNA-methyltransferase (adenine-specific) n=1 Tax=Hyella patelloides LEGE 07179 TaxID=945734 RepID=A0A563VR29_9CYAN|nr:type ISP restriction/modification enzyme [Hyella patelloides]VEP13849.1 Adenine specific DNA methyltransferase [Hyella patelloides LEGE 07179]